MRLIKDAGNGNFSLVEQDENKPFHYAILSHTWGADAEEVTLKDLREGTRTNKAGYDKIRFCVQQAARDGILYSWVDTCCIDKSDNAELSEAINSMYRWYQKADKCYVYLSDVLTPGMTVNVPPLSTTWEVAFRESRWFKRGWTLQELLAPISVEFFSKECVRLGSKRSLEQQIHEITGIAISALRGTPLKDFTDEQRFSWAKDRETKRQEDLAYSLIGIFDVSMTLIYGEGRERAFVRLRDEIRKSLYPPVEQPEPLPSPSSTVPFRPDVDFVDRRTKHDFGTLLEQIEQRCTSAASRVALVGIGGAGKSQLAIEYCHRLRKRSPNTWVFWIYASNVNRIEQGYRQIAERMKIPGRGDPKQNIFDLVVRWLQDGTKGKWLLMLDNLDDETMLSLPQAATETDQQSSDSGGRQVRRPLSAYLPQSENGAILITTRTRRVAEKLVEHRDVIDIGPMADTDAVALLRKKLDRWSIDNHDLEQLADLLEYMPLAIVQAAAYIQQKGLRYTVRQYIEAFQSNEKKQTSLLNHEAGHLRRDPDAKNSIIITWQISFDAIREKWPSSADLLSLMSYFDRQGIPREVLEVRLQDEVISDSLGENTKDGGEEDVDDSDASEANGDDILEEDVDRLRSYSFVTIGEDGQTFEMHRLVQLATRKWLKIHGEDERWKGRFCRKLNAVFPTGEYKNWSLCEMLFPHVKSAERQQPINDRSVREWVQILGRAGSYACNKGDYTEAARMGERSVEAIKKVLGAEDMEMSDSLGLLATTYWKQGRLTEGEKLEIQVLEIRRRVLGEEHPGTLTSISNLASTYWDQGRWTEAEKLQIQVLEIQRRVLGEEHPTTLTSMNNLASTYWNQARWTEAEKLEIQVLEIRRRVLGEEHPSTLTSMNNLASTYWDQARWTEAEKLEIQVLEIRQRVLGEEHPSTLTSMNNLALTYLDQARWTEAEKLKIQVLEIRRRVLGEEHPDTLTSMNNLASTYRDQARWTEAEKLEIQVLEIRQRVLGEEHPSTLTSMNNLASTYWNQARWTEAEKLQIQVLEIRRRVLGEEHPDTLTSMNNLASTYRDQARWTEAEKLKIQVLEIRRRVLGEEHPDTLTSMNNLASTYRDQARWTEAEKLEIQVLEIRRRVLGEEHPGTLTSISNLASTYWDQGRWTEAEKLQIQVLEIQRRVLGEEHPTTLTSMNNLASTYWNQARWTEAEKLEIQVLEIRRRVLGEEHPSTLTSMNNLASTYWNQARWTEAEKLKIQVLEIQRKVLGEEHPSTLTSMNNLALTYLDQARWTEAEKLQIQVLEIQRRVLGEEHPDTLTSMNNLASTYWNQARWTEAEKLKIQVLEIQRKVLGEEHPDTLTSMNNLASTYWNQARWTEAEKLEIQVLEIRQRVLGEEHPSTLTSMNNLALTYLDQARWTEAEKLQIQVLEIRRRVLGEEHPDTLTSMNNLASTYRDQARWTEAEKLEIQVLEIRRRVLGEEHPTTLTSMSNLSFNTKAQGRNMEAISLMTECVQLRNRILGAEHPDALASAEALAKWQKVEQATEDKTVNIMDTVPHGTLVVADSTMRRPRSNTR